MTAGTVIIKRLPQTIYEPTSAITTIENPTIKEFACDCFDDIFASFNPTCQHCEGTGVIKRTTLMSEQVESSTTVTRIVGEKKTWITTATIIVEPEGTIFDDEDGTIEASEYNAFFDAKEDIQIHDIIIKGQEVYIVRSVMPIIRFGTVKEKQCALDIHSVQIPKS